MKTHFPYEFPFTTPFAGTKSLFILRNPLDTIVSYYQFVTTLTHNKSCSNDFTVEFESDWKWFVKDQALIWNQYVKFWLDAGRNKELPVYFIRYEDLVAKQNETLHKTLEFLLGVESISGTYIEKRINDYLTAEKESSHVYKPRSGKINANQKHFSPEQIDYVKEVCRDYINFFGY